MFRDTSLLSWLTNVRCDFDKTSSTMTPNSQDKSQLEDNNDNEFTVLYPTQNTKRIQSLTASVLSTGNKILDKTNSKNVIYSVTKWILSFVLLLTVSVFSYSTFYTSVMPREVHEEDVNFQFVPCDDKPGPCSFPNSSIKLEPHKHRLNIGQPYRVGIILELPDSYVNQVIVLTFLVKWVITIMICVRNLECSCRVWPLWTGINSKLSGVVNPVCQSSGGFAIVWNCLGSVHILRDTGTL